MLFSADELAAAFPAPVLNRGNPILDPRIAKFRIFVFDAAGQVVSESTYLPTPGKGLDLILTGLQLLDFDVVVTGLDAGGNVLTSVKAEDVSPVPNNLAILSPKEFRPFYGFVLPTAANPGWTGGVEGKLNIDGVSVTEVGGQYQVSWDGDPVASISATPIELINDMVADPGNLQLAARVLTEAFNMTCMNADLLSSPTVLDINQAPRPRIGINPHFTGFTGVEYRVGVSRLNGDSGCLDTVLTPRP